jgi:hypothetical protein
MTDPSQPPRDAAPEAGGEVRHLPVPAEAPATRVVDRSRPAVTTPVVAATGGMLMGMLTMTLLRVFRRRQRTVVLRRRRGDRALEVAASRSFLVDVHLIRR